jgi:tripartite-type tricarboxylate transporter receptor subunit TctC
VNGWTKHVAGLTTLGVATLAHAQAPSNYPAKPIRLVIGFSAGSAPDSVARLLTPLLTENIGQPVVVDNRGGAGGSIATELVAKSPADGYTLLLMAAADALQPALRSKLPYDLERDFAPTTIVALGMAALAVHPSLPVHNVMELVALARANPRQLNFGSSGVGSSSHLMGEMFNQYARVKILHVPYKGSADSAIATAAGQIEMSYPGVSAVLPLMEAGKLKVLAVTGMKRASVLPAVPTLNEAGLAGYERTTWWCVVAPAATPKENMARLYAATLKTVNTPEYRAALNRQGLDPQTTTPEQFGAFLHNEIMQNSKVIKLSGAKTE